LAFLEHSREHLRCTEHFFLNRFPHWSHLITLSAVLTSVRFSLGTLSFARRSVGVGAGLRIRPCLTSRSTMARISTALTTSFALSLTSTTRV